MSHRLRSPIRRRSFVPVLVAAIVGLCGSGAASAGAFSRQAVSSGPAAPATGSVVVAGVGESTLSVTGSGVVEVAPDVATVSVEIRSTSASAVGARSKANARTNAVLSAIEKLGVDRGSIQTSGISLSRSQVPATVRHPAHRLYAAANDLSVRTTNVSLVGPIVDAATKAGADSIGGPDFTFGDPSAGRAAAARAALADARRRADDAAAAIGYRVVGVKSVVIDPTSFGPQIAVGATAPAAAEVKAPTPTPVNPGRQEVDATVAVVYVIAGIG